MRELILGRPNNPEAEITPYRSFHKIGLLRTIRDNPQKYFMYTPEERLAYLIDINPEVRTLIETFDLEISL